MTRKVYAIFTANSILSKAVRLNPHKFVKQRAEKEFFFFKEVENKMFIAVLGQEVEVISSLKVTEREGS